MDQQLQTELRKALARDFAFKDRGTFLREGKCPSCGKKEVYAKAERPFMLRCGRLNRCGWEASVKEFYPDIFDDWSKRHPTTEDNPNAAADAYLSHGRGLNLAGLRDAYTQEHWHDRTRNIGSATVRFALPNDTWWERLIDQPGRFDRKARFKYGGSHKGHWWMHPQDSFEDLAKLDRLFLAEGIFDALSLRQAGFPAVSLMSCNNWPEHSLAALRKAIETGATPGRSPGLIFALDVGAAGTEWTRRFVAQARKQKWDASAAMVRPDGEGAKKDWNDLLLLDGLTDAAMEEFLFNGALTIAEDPTERAFLTWQRKGWSSFPFRFRNRLYWARYGADKMEKELEQLKKNFREKVRAEHPDMDPVELKEMLDEELPDWREMVARMVGQVDEICNCAPTVLYRQRNEATDETGYYLRIDHPTRPNPDKGVFAPSALMAPGDFRKRLFAFAGIWTGTTEQLDRLMQDQTRHLKTVEPIDFTGYSKEHGAWLFGDLAVKAGKLHRLNEEDYFDFGGVAVKLATPERILSIDYNPDRAELGWINHVWAAWGPKGMACLAFWIATFFAEQIRARHKTLPFLEIIGEPGTGKSTLLEFFWKLCGREGYEGFDPTKATNAAIARNLGKVANLPVVLIEGDRDRDAPHSRRFEWDELKTAYNGRSVRARGVKSGGNETYEPPFRGAVVIAQNYAVEASPALLERLIQIEFDKANRSAATKDSAEKIERWPTEDVSGLIVHAARSEERWLEVFEERYSHWEAELPKTSGTRHQRIVKNHAQLAAALDASAAIIPAIDEAKVAHTHETIAQLTAARARTIGADHPVVQEFWEIVDWLIANEVADHDRPIDHHSKDDRIAVSLRNFEERCRARGINHTPLETIKKHLRQSKSRRFVNVTTVRCRNSNKAVHCWVFEQKVDRKAKAEAIV